VKNIIPALIIILACLTSLYAQDFSKEKKGPIEISAPRDSLTEGERLEYSVEWLGIPIGIIILKVEGIKKINGHPCYHISAKAMPNKFFRKFYDLEYNVHSYLDCQQLISRRFEKIKRIKSKTVRVTAEFYPEKKEAKYTYSSPEGPLETIAFPSLKKGVISDAVETIAIPEQTKDLVSSLYYFRLSKIKLNQDCTIPITYERNNWTLTMKAEKLSWRDIYKKGCFAVIEVVPDSLLNDSILGKRKIYSTFTADARRIPVEFKLQSNAGVIRGIIKNLSQN